VAEAMTAGQMEGTYDMDGAMGDDMDAMDEEEQ